MSGIVDQDTIGLLSYSDLTRIYQAWFTGVQTIRRDMEQTILTHQRSVMLLTNTDPGCRRVFSQLNYNGLMDAESELSNSIRPDNSQSHGTPTRLNISFEDIDQILMNSTFDFLNQRSASDHPQDDR